MILIRHHTTQGVRYGILIKRGRKWLRFHYVAASHPTRLPITEERYMREIGELTPRQKAIFNRSVRRFGGKRGAV